MTHIPGIWCADLHCAKCYSSDTWQRAKIAELERKLEEAKTAHPSPEYICLSCGRKTNKCKGC